MAGETCYDPVTRRPRVLSEQCATCIFRPGNPMHLNPGRVREMVAGALEQGSQGIICHSTLSYGEHPGFGGALCRGFYDRYGSQSNFIRVIGRLGGFTEVDLPGLAPRNPAFTDADERTEDEPAYTGGMTERQERLSSRSED
jgi:hypothetical protein